jgi:sugar/nucleoside kinase (ribokinase family)
MFRKRLDFAAVGDVTTDAFIRLKDASVHCNIDNDRCELCMRFADKIPYESVEVVKAVGNSANAAVSAARLGLKAGLISNIGDDENGRDCIAALKAERVDTREIVRHTGALTNYHYVLWYEAERTILVKHQEYARRFPADMKAPKWLYISSLGGDTEGYHNEMMDYIDAHPEMKVAFQPGTFQMSLGREKLARLYRRCDVFVCNTEEAQRILGTEEKDPKQLLSLLAALGPKIVLLTDGPKGAYMLDAGNAWFVPPYPDPKAPFERTGAGDAFASTFAAMIALGKTPQEALRAAPINSMSVVQQVGAQKGLLSFGKLQEWLAKAPLDYTIRQL